MAESKALRAENDKLRIAHGSDGGRANYRWEFSENLYFPMRVPGEWDHRANAAGIIEVTPVFEQRKMCPHLHRQWVLCRFIAPPPETIWKEQFGSAVEWPSGGYYAPTNVELDEGVSPWDSNDGVTLTDMVVRFAANDRAKTTADWNREGEEIVEKREAAYAQKRSDMLDELLFSFPNSDHIPGKRGGGVVWGGAKEALEAPERLGGAEK